MRPVLVSRLIVSCLMLVSSMAFAQQTSPNGGRIQVIVGPSSEVARQPTFASIGDIDGDGIGDAAISSLGEDVITSALSAGNGTFASLIPFPVGRHLGDLTLLFANTDNNLDVASTDRTVSTLGGGIFVSAGNGNGSFNIPVFVESTTRAERMVTADFDNRNGPDIATANGRRVNFQTRSDDITIILNRGSNRGFAPGVGYGVGDADPDDIDAADFDSDGDIDLVLLDVDPRNVDEVVVVQNDGMAQFLVATNFSTGLGEKALTVADLNEDRIPDIAVVNDDPARRLFSISILLDRTRLVGGVLRGTGIFDIIPPINIPCPPSFNGIPIVCSMRDIGAGDFNGDGLNDLVISIDTRTEDDIGVTTPGVLFYFEGLGNGEFVPSTMVNIGVGPSGIDVGDMTGDALPDVVVTQTRDNSIAIVRSVLPPQRDNGEPCRISSQCESGSCVDGVCCETSSCPSGQRCDIFGNEGTCSPPGDNGDRCELGEQCASGFCVDGFCCSARDCPANQFCNTGSCGPPADPGTPCSEDEQCDPPNCVDGFCCTSPTCPVGSRCDIPDLEGVCTPKHDLGDDCTNDGQCSSGFCTDGVCCQVDNCEIGFACNINPNEGFCRPLPTPSATPTATPTPQPIGAPCTRPDQCQSNFCVDGVCCGTANCPPNQFCNISTDPGSCNPQVDPGACCNIDHDCRTNNCDPNDPAREQGCFGACGPVRTPTPRGPGAPCNTTPQCQAGFECNLEEGGLCCNELHCPEGTSCRVPGSEGFCHVLATPTPTRLPNGGRCSANMPEVCQSNFCVNDRCCNASFCVGTDRCDIFGNEGQCQPPLQEGEVCAKNTDCLPGLVCTDEFGQGLHCVFRRPTVTPITPDAPTPTVGATIIVSRDSGGCEIDAGHNASSAWLLLSLPLFAWVRRSQLAPRRVTRR